MTYSAHGVSVRIGSATLLEDVSLEIRPGQVVALAGPNGAGKTTLIRVLSGERHPSPGSVTLGGQPITDRPRALLAQHRAVMSADRSVAFAFTAREVVLMGRLPHHGGHPTDADGGIIDGLLTAVDSAHLADRVFATLSSGERQRVALAQAIAQVSDGPTGPDDLPRDAGGRPAGGPDERYLLLDEPTSSLDPAHQHMAMRLLRREAAAGRGVLAVLHDLNLAAAYADRIVLMARGRVVASGSPTEVLRADLLESVFDIPMLVLSHPQLSHPLVVADPAAVGRSIPAV